MKNNKKTLNIVRTIAIIICILICFGNMILVGKNGRTPNNLVFIGGIPIKANSINGVIQGCTSLLCATMVCIERRKGRLFASGFLVYSILQTTMVCIFSHVTDPIPGILNSIITLITINIIAEALERYNRRGFHDVVTGLLNQRGFMSALQDKTKSNKKFHVLYIHLNDIRTVMEDLRYDYIELIFQEIAKRIKAVTDTKCFIGKLDGSVFAVIVPISLNVYDISSAISKALEQEITVEENGVSVSVELPAYIGVSAFPDHGKDGDSLMRCAGLSAYYGFTEKNESIVFYDDNMEEIFHQKDLIEKKIREALDSDCFYLVYQPQYITSTHKIRGFETLIRCKFPDGEAMYPSTFIPVAEKSELITEIDYYVIKKAIHNFKNTVVDAETPLVLSINVSAKTMCKANFVDFVRTYLEVEKFPANSLEIEITEYSFAESLKQTITNIMGLKELGVMIALDDFGTGYTSLAQLLNLPINLLKIDKSLIDDIENNKMNQDFVDSVIYMGHLMNCEVISEGVETEGQLQVLKDHECDFIQGFIWGKPLEEDVAKKLVTEGN